MKRYGYLFEKIITTENLMLAHEKAKRGKGHYKEVKIIDKNPLFYIKQIQKSLINKTFTTSEYEIYTVNDTGKEREIHKLPYYPDRIVQWAIMLQIEDILVSTFIYDTYAAIPKRGMHLALNRLHKSMEDREGTQYCLQLDVKKFFPSINENILKGLLRRKFKDPNLLWLLDDIIDSTKGKGVPIGNYTSQYFGNFYLTYFDHYMKEVKKCRHYFRYMDDIVILHHSKAHLHELRKNIDRYFREQLKLSVKENWQVFPTYVRGVDFVGYRSFGDYTLLRKTTAKRLKRKMALIRKRPYIKPTDLNSIMSYRGWLEHCDSYNLDQKHIVPTLRRFKNESKKYSKSKSS